VVLGAQAQAAGTGAPTVALHGRLRAAAEAAGLHPASALRLSISHTDSVAVAVAIVKQ